MLKCKKKKRFITKKTRLFVAIRRKAFHVNSVSDPDPQDPHHLAGSGSASWLKKRKLTTFCNILVSKLKIMRKKKEFLKSFFCFNIFFLKE